STITDGWEKIVFNFTTDNIAGQNVLYIGGLTIEDMMDNVPAPPGVGGCNYSEVSEYNEYSYYYIDNVSLTPLNNLIFSDTVNSSPVTHNAYDYIKTNNYYLVVSNSEVSLKEFNYIVINFQSQIYSGFYFF